MMSRYVRANHDSPQQPPQPHFLNIAVILIILLIGLGCQQIQINFDLNGLEKLADNINRNDYTSSVEEIERFIKEFDLDKETAPLLRPDIQITDLDRWSLRKYFPDLIEEKISFTGALPHAPPQVNQAHFFYYHKPAPTATTNPSKMLIFIPGLGVSDFAFRFLRDFFTAILDEGYQLIVYVPPYHMERSRTSKENYYQLFSFNTLENISNVVAMVKELRTLIEYLDRQGKWDYSIWGGSIGATVALNLERYLPLRHLTVMIPVVNFNLLLQHPILKTKVLSRLNEKGIDIPLLERAYRTINPVDQSLQINPDQIFIMASEYDQLNPPHAIQTYAESKGIQQLQFYPRSHSSILLDDELYRDYHQFLQEQDMLSE